MKKLLLFLTTFTLLIFTGCASAPKITPAQRTQMRTKTFDADYEITFKSLMSTLESHGYTIDNTDMTSGLIKATSVKDSASSFQKAFGQYGTSTFDISSTLTKASKDSTRVRINIRQKDEGSYGYQRMSSAADIDTPEIYQALFNDLRTEIERMKAIN